MFLAHFALAFAAKRVAPRASLGTLFAAAQLADLVWPALVLAGVEVVRVAPRDDPFARLDFERYPYTHSLLAAGIWAALFGLGYLATRGYRAGARVAAALVASHWFLDALGHRPDLPLWPGGPRVGLGLWRSVPATLAVELGLFAAGVAIYAVTTRPRGLAGRLALAALVIVLLLVYGGSVLGPPPPSATAMAAVGLVGTVALVAAAVAVDRQRTIRGAVDGA